MGSVLEAENTLTHKRVAIKWMHPALARDPEAVARLTREAQASSRVRHPNVVDVYDVVRDGDTVFLVMEFLEGEPLSAALSRGGLPMHELIALLLPAMRGVAAAHKQGVVHRDIKPDNIFLARQPDTTKPVPKVLDFGISKLEARGAEQLSLTRTGSTMGTPMYMSFEQLTGAKDIDGRADVYAFGVILYEALTGRPPFEADTFPELAIKIATTDPVPLKEIRADIPRALANLVQWAMARDRDQRVGSMDALILELESFESEHSFRAQMTMDGVSLPKMASQTPAPIANPGELAVDSQGRLGTPVRATLPYSRKRTSRMLLASLALGGALAVVLLVALLVGAARKTREGNLPVQPVRAGALPAASEGSALQAAPKPAIAALPGAALPSTGVAPVEVLSETERDPKPTLAASRPTVATKRDPRRTPAASDRVTSTAETTRTADPQDVLRLRAPMAEPLTPAPSTAPVPAARFRVGQPPKGQDF